PWRRHDVDRHPIRPGHEQEVSPLSGLEVIHLSIGQAISLLKFERFGMFLGAQQQNARIRSEHCTVLGFEEVPRILAHQDETTAIFANTACKPNEKSANRFVLEKQP